MSRHSNYQPLSPGETIGDMYLLRAYRDTKNDRRMFSVRCTKCNRIREVSEANLKNRPNSSIHEIVCGFGLKKSVDPKFYDVWAHMKDRIYNPNNSEYYRYGGRGLTTDYDAFVDFFDDYYASYIQTTTMYPNTRISIDRINNNLGYVRGNISWATPIQQTRNSTTVKQFIAQAPNGQLYLTNNQLQFGLNHGLESKHISDCLLGKQATTGGGWRFYKLNPLFVYNFDNDSRFIKELYY